MMRVKKEGIQRSFVCLRDGKRDLGKERDFLLSKREKIHEGRPRKHATLTSTASTYSYSSLLFSSLVVLIDDKNDEEEERFLLLCQGAINAAALRLPLRFVSSFVSSSRNVYLGCCTNNHEEVVLSINWRECRYYER